MSSLLRGRLEAIRRDMTDAIRSLRSRPGFTIAIAAILGLGIGANAAMFTIIDRLFLRQPAHVLEPGRVVQYRTYRQAGKYFQVAQPYQTYRDLRDSVPQFAEVAAATPSNIGESQYFPLGRGASATQVAGSQVTPSFFRVLGVKPERGRFFTDAEAGESNPQPLAVISHGFWQRHFAGRSDAIGAVLQLGAMPFTVVGIAPPGFRGVQLTDVDVWIPIAAAAGLRFAKGDDWMSTRGSQWMQVIGRLRDDVTEAEARQRATIVERANTRAELAARGQPTTRADSVEVQLSPLTPARLMTVTIGVASPELRISRLLAAVSLVVLLLTCINVSTLLLVRALNRRRDTAVRLALGAGRRRLITQVVMEGLLLAILGGTLSIGVAVVGGQLLGNALLSDVDWSRQLIGGRLVAFIGIAVLLTTFLTAVIPAWQTSAPNLTAALRSGVRESGSAGTSTRSLLVGMQAALALVLVVGSGLFVRSLRNIAALPLGIDVDRVLVASVKHSTVGLSDDQAARLFRSFVDRAKTVPSVQGAAVALATSFGVGWGTTLHVPGQPTPAEARNPSQYAVTEEYFSVMGVRLLRGRTFDDRDRAGSERVAVINQTAAETYWPGASPIGQCVKLGADTMPCTTVIGVVTNARRQQLIEMPVAQVYRPLDQVPAADSKSMISFFGYSLVVRTGADARTVIEPLRRTLQASSAELPYISIVALSERVSAQSRTWNVGATVFTAFGVVALVLSAFGLFSVVSYSVAQRKQEFGVRLALGATHARIVQLTLSRGARPAFWGLLVGLVVVRLTGQFVAPMLYEVSAYDPFVLAGAAVLLSGAALGAGLIPARRASRVHPMTVLRGD